MNYSKGIIKKKFNKKQLIDAGLALVLLLLATGLFLNVVLCYKLAALVVILDMTIPIVIFPFAFIWYNISEILGLLSSRILLTLVFLTIVLPVALIRRLLKKDPLQLNSFKKSKGSAFIKREYLYKKEDLIHPF